MLTLTKLATVKAAVIATAKTVVILRGHRFNDVLKRTQ